MLEIEFEGKKYRTDEAGFIQDLGKWSPKMARLLAKQDAFV